MRASETELLDDLRPRIFAIAYRMLGSVSEAEDVVQKTLLRVHSAIEGGEERVALGAVALADVGHVVLVGPCRL